MIARPSTAPAGRPSLPVSDSEVDRAMARISYTLRDLEGSAKQKHNKFDYGFTGGIRRVRMCVCVCVV